MSKLGKGDELIGMSILKREEEGAKGQGVLCVSEKGLGKRTYASEYRTSGRGGQGVINMNLTAKTGDVIATFPKVVLSNVVDDFKRSRNVIIGFHVFRCSSPIREGLNSLCFVLCEVCHFVKD